MSPFRKKPVTIEAFKLDGGEPWPDWAHRAWDAGEIFTKPDPGAVFIRTLEGEMRANSGDWIIKGVKGELYPCKPDIFEERPAK